MKRSRSIQSGFDGLWCITRVYSMYASGASAIGVPGWPEFAFCTASIESVRIVSTHSSSSFVVAVSVAVMGSGRCERRGPLL